MDQQVEQQTLGAAGVSCGCGQNAAAAGDRLRVAVVTETYPPELNGVSLTVARAVEHLRTRGHIVEVLRPRQPADPMSPTGHCDYLLPGVALPLYPGVRFGLPAATRLKLKWGRARPDVVHIATEGPLGWSALQAARALALPVTSDYRTHFPRYSDHYGVGWLAKPINAYLRLFHNRANVTFVSTAALQRELAARGYENVAHVGRGIDTQLFNPARRSDALRAQWGLRPEALAVIHVGRLAAEKNLQVAVRAFRRVRALRPDARMIWVGDGPQRRKLERENPGHVFMGVKRGAELAACYASADMFLFPSLTETFGNVMLEALASGLAVVAFKEGAAAQHAREDVNARVIPVGDEEAFLAAAEALAGAPESLARLRANAPHAVAALTWPAVLNEFERHLVVTAQHSRGYADALAAG